VSELRWHPLLREWVTVAPVRQDRTYHPDEAHCPLCPTRPGMKETEIPEPDYHIAVFENKFPSYTHDQGRCEVVCYTSKHDSSLGEQSVAHTELSALPEVKYVFIFENRGEEIGVTLSHPHGQIYAYPFVPPVVEREQQSGAAHFEEHGTCLYCGILEGEWQGERTVAENDRWLAFVPEFARWPYEVHLAPREHVGDITELSAGQADAFAHLLKVLLQKYDALFGKPLAYVMAMHQRPHGERSGHYHFHVEFYPPNRTADKLKMLAGSELGAGAFILDARAEETAKRLREVGS
jgi:UDPglucose--hexose-1-phosphate uridylyltransferase